MNQQPRPPSEDINPMRHTVLGEMHHGDLKLEETHPFLKKMVRFTLFGNITCLVGLWLSFRILDLFPPHDQPFMTSVGYYFFFGAMYGVFSLTLFTLGTYSAREAMIKAVTVNRRYEFHSRYDTKNIREEDLKKVAENPGKKPLDGKHEQSGAVNAGAKSYFYSGVFAVCGIGTCLHGIYSFIVTLF